MDYSKRQVIKVGVDFIEVMFDTLRPTQAMHVKNSSDGLFSYVKGCDPETGNPYPDNLTNTTTSRFLATIHNPFSINGLHVLSLGYVYANFSSFRLIRIELFCDTYCKNADVSDLAKVAFDRYRFHDDADSHDWYFYRKSGEGRKYVNTLSGREYANVDPYRAATKLLTNRYMLGNAESTASPKRTRVYVKTYDRIVDGIPTIELPKEEWRARIEVRLEGDAIPCQTLEDLQQLDMRKLINGHFKFLTYSERLHPAARYAIERTSVARLGKRGCRRRSTGKITARRSDSYSGTALYRKSVKADTPLAKQIDAAARRFDRQWRKE